MKEAVIRSYIKACYPRKSQDEGKTNTNSSVSALANVPF